MHLLICSKYLLIQCLCLLVVGCFTCFAEEPTPDEHFTLKVMPILTEKCLACHGTDPKDLRGELDLSSREGFLKGGESGDPSLIPGKPDESVLMEAIRWEGYEMPPKENDRLTPDQIAIIEKWVADGAVWPSEEQQTAIKKSQWQRTVTDEGIIVKTSGGMDDDWTYRRYDPDSLWAFQPVQVVEIPQNGASHPIDAFLNAKLIEQHIPIASKADRRTLIRRATFDLLGLPPSPKEIGSFVNDQSPEAWEDLIDRLLSNPHYAEQMSRHWLDVVRYADTAGFSNDFARPTAWRYRDYVIRSFAEDKPYDRFIMEQIAGDELDPDDPEMKIAVGFLRMGPWEHTAMSVAAVTRQQYLDNVTHNVGEVMMGMAMNCCKCHDHKFDPLPQQDYYRMQAIFAPVQFSYLNVPFLPEENTNRMQQEKSRIQAIIKSGDQKLILPEDASDEQIEMSNLGLKKVKRKQQQTWNIELLRYQPLALSVFNGPNTVYTTTKPRKGKPKNLNGKVQEIQVLSGGSIESPLQTVQPAVLSIVDNFQSDGSPLTKHASIPKSTDGRRLAFSRWLTHPDHPLTARVMVNRIWQWHFGRGLAANSNNFGSMGSTPTHPELLDYLARYFMEHDWSIKAMHQLIMTSEAYQRRSQPATKEVLSELDPLNDYLSWFRPRRLTAEEIRDSMLAISGELNPEQGGIPVYPEINFEVAMQPRHVMGSVAPAYQPSRTPDERHRRTIYAIKIRTLRDPMLEVFDQPGPDMSCERRDESTITPQVFSLFNAQTSYDRAVAMAQRLDEAHTSSKEKVQAAFELTYGRPATPVEVARILKHVEQMTDYHKQHPLEPREYPKSIVREMVEEMTGLTFQWEEQLDQYQHFVSDLKPWQVSPEIRAWADVCLVLMNSNEFLYVY